MRKTFPTRTQAIEEAKMDLDNMLQGHLVAAVFEVLLVDAGYQVVPLGVERTIRELRTLDRETYKDLRVHPRLRTIPDLFVLDIEAHQSWLTEIKFRHYLHPRLFDDLQGAQRDWAPFSLILVLADHPPEWKKGIVHHIRVFEIEANFRLDEGFFTDNGQRLQDVFVRLGPKWQEATIRKAQDAILRITSNS